MCPKLCPQITKDATHCWLKVWESWVTSLPPTHTHTQTNNHSHCQHPPCDYFSVTLEESFGLSWVTVGRPLQQSRNVSLHCQDYLPVEAKRNPALIQSARIRLGLITGQNVNRRGRNVPLVGCNGTFLWRITDLVGFGCINKALRFK